jgi:hypothetical protein
MELTLKITDGTGATLAERSGTDEVCLVYRQAYQEGDSIAITTSAPGQFLVMSLDDGMPEALVFMKEPEFHATIPWGASRKAYSPKAFSGSLHRLFVRLARADEIAARRNLAFNPYDADGDAILFPHAFANVITRGEAAFAARNAIDGEKANDDHGIWPYTSWGINQDPRASLTVEFGRPVRIDEIVFYLRADFPHDAWWQRASVTFSDGHTMELDLQKSAAGQRFAVAPRETCWIRLHDLMKADDPSPFPALTQIELWGTEA